MVAVVSNGREAPTAWRFRLQKVWMTEAAAWWLRWLARPFQADRFTEHLELVPRKGFG